MTSHGRGPARLLAWIATWILLSATAPAAAPAIAASATHSSLGANDASLQKTKKSKTPTVALSASSMSVAPGGAVTLNWTSTNATSCVASGGWSGGKPPAGSAGVSGLDATSTFTLTCSKKKKGSASASVTVTVSSPPPSGPPAPGETLADVVSIDAASQSTCAVTIANQTYCWGQNKFGVLGTGDTEQRLVPARSHPGMSFRKVVIGKGTGGFACGLTTDGSAYCWGLRMKLGDGVQAPYPEFSAIPVLVAGGRKYVDIAAGGDHACAVSTDGDAWCWGYNGGGQLGTGNGDPSWVPAPVTGGHKFKAISANIVSTCAVATDGAAYCWGSNLAPGDGAQAGGNTPARVTGGFQFESISVGMMFACGVTRTGEGYCWGDNGVGNLGDGTFKRSGGPVTTPVKVAGNLTWKSITAAVFVTCGVTVDGSGHCWGGNVMGERGNGQTSSPDVATPQPIAGGLKFSAISADWHNCGVTADGGAYCWGMGDFGALGNGDAKGRNSPTPVAGPK